MGPRLYVGGELRLGDPSVTITAPSQGQSFLSSQSIPLNATVDGGIRLSLYTGLDLKAGIAGLQPQVDPQTCPLPSTTNTSNLESFDLDSEQHTRAQSYTLGGPYGPLRTALIGVPVEVHHIPAKKSYLGITTLTRYSGPSIVMDPDDHRLTDSNGSQNYVQGLKDLVRCCQFDKAFERDILDVKIKFPGKYDNRISEMRSYFSTLLKEQKYPKGCPQNP